KNFVEVLNVSSNLRNYRHDLLRHGICIPTTCPNATSTAESLQLGVERCYNQKYRGLGLKGNITKILCEKRETNYPIDIYDIIFA
ncbi:hypothetical protein NQ314_020573, partial [Rhamnusium bicolor]